MSNRHPGRLFGRPRKTNEHPIETRSVAEPLAILDSRANHFKRWVNWLFGGKSADDCGRRPRPETLQQLGTDPVQCLFVSRAVLLAVDKFHNKDGASEENGPEGIHANWGRLAAAQKHGRHNRKGCGGRRLRPDPAALARFAARAPKRGTLQNSGGIPRGTADCAKYAKKLRNSFGRSRRPTTGH
jgi:hypothetical protein